ncbi:DUF6801 domain-containing protein [Streptomyces asiaticus]
MKRQVVGKALKLVTAIAITGGIVGAFGAEPAAADPMSLTLRYTCSVQSISVPITVRLDADAPKLAKVGEPTPKLGIRARVPLSAAETKRLGKIGVEGTVDAKIHVAAPGVSRDVRVPFTVARTHLPGSGSFDVKATGVVPAFHFSQPGTAKITVGDLNAHITAGSDGMNARLNVPCRLDTGRPTVVASFPVVRPGTTTGPSTSGTPGAAISGTTGSTTSGGTEAKVDGTTRSNDPSGRLATAGSQGINSLIPLAAGSLLLGTLAMAVAFRLRSGGK